MFPNVIDVRILAQKADSKETPDKGPRLGRSPQDLFTEYLKERGEDNDELKVLFSELLEEVYASDET
jgi:hypothetical protein